MVVGGVSVGVGLLVLTVRPGEVGAVVGSVVRPSVGEVLGGSVGTVVGVVESVGVVVGVAESVGVAVGVAVGGTVGGVLTRDDGGAMTGLVEGVMYVSSVRVTIGTDASASSFCG
ncbi:MAG TPA: hypothetical protein VIH10_07215 [Kribbella sp.]